MFLLNGFWKLSFLNKKNGLFLLRKSVYTEGGVFPQTFQKLKTFGKLNDSNAHTIPLFIKKLSIIRYPLSIN